MSIIAASRFASGSNATGGVSTITQSNCCAASARRRFIVSDTRPAIGSESALPAVSAERFGEMVWNRRPVFSG